METIKIVLDKRLLNATDHAARQTKRNRSAFVRDALREYLGRSALRARETRDHQGYAKQPSTDYEIQFWEGEAAWSAEPSKGLDWKVR